MVLGRSLTPLEHTAIDLALTDVVPRRGMAADGLSLAAAPH
jgi:hypothetical protein